MSVMRRYLRTDVIVPLRSAQKLKPIKTSMVVKQNTD